MKTILPALRHQALPHKKNRRRWGTGFFQPAAARQTVALLPYQPKPTPTPPEASLPLTAAPKVRFALDDSCRE